MPQVPIIKEIMDVVQHLKPWFVLSIGNSLVADLCSNIVPVIQLPTVTVGGMSTKATFQIVGRKVNDDDRQWVQRRGLPEDYIVESRPVYSFKSQTHQYTRKQLGLPENRFVVLLVGYRLDEEIDEACIETIVRLAEKEIFIAFVGIFEKYDSLVEKYGQLKNQSVFLGLQEDTLAINECCDVYLNPKRVGGGTSGAEALYKGSPVVTFDFGDVGNVAGPDFHVADYDEMYEKIIRYAEDKEYYGEMSRKAKQRAEALADSKSEFVRVIEKIEKSDRFR
jgi:glycosyltransferase involved in cell wall biosynthesis